MMKEPDGSRFCQPLDGSNDAIRRGNYGRRDTGKEAGKKGARQNRSLSPQECGDGLKSRAKENGIAAPTMKRAEITKSKEH
jgi:hypothetical protein